MGGLGSSGPGDLRQHHARLLSGGGVDVVVAEENLRSRSVGSAVLGHVVGTDVDCGGSGLFDHLDGGSLAVGTAHTVGLTFEGLDDQEDSAVVGKSLVQLEGEGVTLAHDSGRGRVLYTHESGRVGLRSAAAGDNPVVQTGEEVRAGNFTLGTEDAAGLLAQGEFVLGEDLVVRQTPPHSSETLENALDLGLVSSADTAAISAVADILAALHFRSGHTLGTAAHLLEGDGRNVLHKRLSLRNCL